MFPSLFNRKIGWFVAVSVLVAVLVLSACGSPAPASTTQTSLTTPTKLTTSPPPVTTTTTSNVPTNTAAPNGEDLYQRTAGGMGCAGCHGTDAYGNIGPAIRDATAQEIKEALQNVSAMKSIKLTDAEINAIAAYLKQLK